MPAIKSRHADTNGPAMVLYEFEESNIDVIEGFLLATAILTGLVFIMMFMSMMNKKEESKGSDADKQKEMKKGGLYALAVSGAVFSSIYGYTCWRAGNKVTDDAR
jgi:hypothetical protein